MKKKKITMKHGGVYKSLVVSNSAYLEIGVEAKVSQLSVLLSVIDTFLELRSRFMIHFVGVNGF